MSLRDEIAAAASAMLAITSPTEERRTESPVNETPIYDRMTRILLDVDVTPTERAALLSMAVSIDFDRFHWRILSLELARNRYPSLLYFEGHDRLALALGIRPGTRDAERKVDRVIESLISKGLIVERGAQYELVVLSDAPTADQVTA